jgi:ribonuclease P protein component
MNPAESPLFSVRTAPRGFHKRPLVVFVGKKAAKQAAVRNLIKRRIVAAFKKTFPTAPARDILLNAKPAIGKATYADIEREIKRIFGSL